MSDRCARAAFAAVLLAVAGCGGTRQDANEPNAAFRVDITRASFPAQQSIAQSARLRIDVHNSDRRAVPNVAVTVQTKPAHPGAAPLAFGEQASDTRLADPAKPVWIVDVGPKGGDTAATNTWALGTMAPGETKRFTWKVTAVQAGTYTISYRVAPGLNGKARAARGSRAVGSFQVTIADKPVPAHVDDNGKVVRGKPAAAGKN